MPTVSVVVPVHNRISWAVEAVRSVLDQTYADFEVVVVDDGSTEDPTPLRVADERVRYVRQENRGASAARNLGLGLARGRYVAFLDADDLFVPGKLERQATVMEGRPDVAISHTSYLLMDHEGRDIGEVRSGRYTGSVYPRIYTDSHGIATPTVMVRRDALGERARFNESVRYGEDALLWAELVKGSELLGIDEPLAKVRVHGNNAISNLDASVEGVVSVMRYGVLRDGDLTALRRRVLLSTLHVALSHLYLLRKQGGAEALRSALRALRLWPLNRRAYWFLALLIYKRVAGRARGS